MSSKEPTEEQAEKLTFNGDSVTGAGNQSHFDTPVHALRLPLLTKGCQVIYPNGFLSINFLFIAACAALSFIIGNFQRHGFLINPFVWIDQIKVDGHISLLPLAFIIPWPIITIVPLLIEKCLASGKLSDSIGKVAHIFWITVIFMYPIAVVTVYGRPMPYAIGFTSFCTYAGLVLKMWSFVDTNNWYRQKWLSQKKASENKKDDKASENTEENSKAAGSDIIEYPANLTFKGFYYFIFLPTLCYELHYPTTGRRNYKVIARRLGMFSLNTVALLAALQQWISPSVQYRLHPYAEGQMWVLSERIFSTIVGECVTWLLIFLFVFHNLFILMAELLCFGDQRYYADWWQAENQNIFWRKWNLPVHHWIARHLHQPLIQRGYNEQTAKYAVFIVSGILHEYFCSGPLRIFRLHITVVFIAHGFILNDLSVYVSQRFGREIGITYVGILVAWINLLPLMYAHDVIVAYYGEEELDRYRYF